nr:hypothetical protein Iba_chr15eCG2370 [Ipomoea batatas]
MSALSNFPKKFPITWLKLFSNVKRVYCYHLNHGRVPLVRFLGPSSFTRAAFRFLAGTALGCSGRAAPTATGTAFFPACRFVTALAAASPPACRFPVRLFFAVIAVVVAVVLLALVFFGLRRVFRLLPLFGVCGGLCSFLGSFFGNWSLVLGFGRQKILPRKDINTSRSPLVLLFSMSKPANQSADTRQRTGDSSNSAIANGKGKDVIEL